MKKFLRFNLLLLLLTSPSLGCTAQTNEKNNQTSSKVIEGEYKLRFPNGKLQIEGQYVNNNKTGIWKTYHENGEIASKGLFNAECYKVIVDTVLYDGTTFVTEREVGKDGKWQYWDEKGRIIGEDFYKKCEIIEVKEYWK